MRLSTKIISLMVLMSLLTGVIVGGVTLTLMGRSFNSYLADNTRTEINTWRDTYLDYYEANGDSWLGVQNYVQQNSAVRTNYGVWVMQEPEVSVVLLSSDGMVLTNSDSELVGGKARERVMDYSYPLYARDTGELIGYLAPANYFDSQFWMLINSYLSDTRQSVVLGIAVTLLIAIIIGWFAARNLTKPLEKLTRSVRRIGQGAMNEKVNIENDDEIGELALAFNQMSSELSRANDARVQMFADISHELRTPITAIAGTLENKLVKNEVCEPEELSALYDEMLRLGGMVTELQNISRLDAGHMPINKTLINFEEFVKDFVVLFEADAETRDITVKVEYADKLPYCYADPERLKQIVLNLVSNALRYTTDGGVVILNAWADKENFIFSVADTGIGMSEEECQHVFDRFYRSDRSRARETGGTGLGMAITQGLVLAHGGRIEVKSKKDVGTTFTVYLPLYNEKAEIKKEKAEAKREKAEAKK